MNAPSLFILLCATFSSIICIQKPITINTDYGAVEGYETDIARVFYGIPYAQPPVDKLR